MFTRLFAFIPMTDDNEYSTFTPVNILKCKLFFEHASLSQFVFNDLKLAKYHVLQTAEDPKLGRIFYICCMRI